MKYSIAIVSALVLAVQASPADYGSAPVTTTAAAAYAPPQSDSVPASSGSAPAPASTDSGSPPIYSTPAGTEAPVATSSAASVPAGSPPVYGTGAPSMPTSEAAGVPASTYSAPSGTTNATGTASGYPTALAGVNGASTHGFSLAAVIGAAALMFFA